ncbi:hypothetical protein [Oceanobacillus oncorhynchi]|uniref:hypothetical protein n=1 Tax=Oceanobacillus oncorhynchi TaxID=545501 RepID=UPI0034D720E7
MNRIEKVKKSIREIEQVLEEYKTWRDTRTGKPLPKSVTSTLVAGEAQFSSRLRKEKKLLKKLESDEGGG